MGKHFGDWRPMSNAPKDGTAILLLHVDGRMAVGKWKTQPVPGKLVGSAEAFVETSYWAFGMESVFDESNIRFWMRLPSMPDEPTLVRTRDAVIQNQIERCLKTFPFEAYHAALVRHHETDPGYGNGGITHDVCKPFPHSLDDMKKNGRELLEKVADEKYQVIHCGFLMAIRGESSGGIRLDLFGYIAQSHNGHTPFVGEIWMREEAKV